MTSLVFMNFTSAFIPGTTFLDGAESKEILTGTTLRYFSSYRQC